MDYESNRDAITELYQQIGDRVREVVNDTARETADQELVAAVDLLHARVNSIQGLSFPRDWSHEALETLRRGDDFEIRLQ